jgi:hypothetical protein
MGTLTPDMEVEKQFLTTRITANEFAFVTTLKPPKLREQTLLSCN